MTILTYFYRDAQIKIINIYKYVLMNAVKYTTKTEVQYIYRIKKHFLSL